jgi:excisionase family DNA binding protein
VEEDFYSVDEAARILRLTPGRIRQMLRASELEGIAPEESGGRGWKIPMHAVHDRDRPARVERSGATEAPESPERLSELEVEVRTLRYELGLSRGRLELTEKAESTLREERDRLLAERDQERERADAERDKSEKLQAELDRARLPWWRKMFGGI